jgi:hypothetical protein
MTAINIRLAFEQVMELPDIDQTSVLNDKNSYLESLEMCAYEDKESDQDNCLYDLQASISVELKSILFNRLPKPDGQPS